MNALEECHKQLARLLGSDAEPLEVLRRTEEHRAYWRPEHVRVLLLAESHVHTTPSELARRIVLPDSIGRDVPRGFVRLVYCLGYGENHLLDRPIADSKNSGTPQFWKIFYSCINRVSTHTDFISILSTTPPFEHIVNKLALLRRLKESGVWLLDASLAALYPKPSPTIVTRCLRTSWDAYVGQVVRTAKPMRIVCIGIGVHSALRDRLSGLGVPVTVVPQPNAHLDADAHLAVFQQYYPIVLQALQEQAPANVQIPLPTPQFRAPTGTRLLGSPENDTQPHQTSPLCQAMTRVPPGVRVRSWTLRQDDHAHFHNMVSLRESPLYLELSWRPSVSGRARRVGLFKLNLAGLLQGQYIRHDPVGSDGVYLRLRVVRADDGLFYIQARGDGPRIQLPTSGEDKAIY